MTRNYSYFLGLSFFCSAILLSIQFGAIPLACAQTPAGSVTALSGHASLKRGTATSNISDGEQLLVGDTVATGPASSMTILLTDQSKLQLSDLTTITLNQQLVGAHGRVSTRIGLVSGLLRSFVHLTSAGGAPNFEVHTPNAIAAARGTDYETSYSSNRPRPGYPNCMDFTDVMVFDGVVEVRNAANPSAPGVMVRAGYTTAVPCALPPLAIGPLGVASPPRISTRGGSVAGFTGVPPSVGSGGGAPPPAALPAAIPPLTPEFPE